MAYLVKKYPAIDKEKLFKYTHSFSYFESFVQQSTSIHKDINVSHISLVNDSGSNGSEEKKYRLGNGTQKYSIIKAIVLDIN